MNKFLLLCVSVMAMKAEGVGGNVDFDNVSVTGANPTSSQSGVTTASIGASVDYTARFMEEQAKKIKALDNANSLEQQYRELQGVYNAFIDNTDIGDDDPKIKNVLDLVTDAQSLINSNANKDDIHRALVRLEVELRMIADAMTPLDILNRIIDKDTSSELYSKLLDRLQSDSTFTAVLKKLMPAPTAGGGDSSGGGGAALDLTSLDTLKGRLEALRDDVKTWQVGGGGSSGIDYEGRPGDIKYNNTVGVIRYAEYFGYDRIALLLFASIQDQDIPHARHPMNILNDVSFHAKYMDDIMGVDFVIQDWQGSRLFVSKSQNKFYIG